MFFEPSSFSERTLTMDYFHEWANGIANSYLQGGVPPTTSLCKLAQAEDLTPDQIQLLATETNKKIHAVKFASAKDKYFAADFPLADARAAITSLQSDRGEVKIAYTVPQPRLAERALSAKQMFGVEPEAMDKTASMRHDVKHAAAKAELLEQKLNDRCIMNKIAVAEAEKTFIKQARQYVLAYAESPEARMKVLGTLGQFVKSAKMDFAKSALAKLASVLGREGKIEPGHTKVAVEHFLAKKADETAPQELISNWLPAQIVNGNHPLYITLKTFQDRSSALEIDENRHQLIQDKLKILRQQVRAL